MADEAERTSERLERGRFHVGCVGQFKRGKSTLLNALIGDPVLPTGVVPVTSVITVIGHGDERRARVLTSAGGWEAIPIASLADYVSEAGNPGNRKGVEVVEVSVPSPLLEAGMCLVDTPGVGSVFAEAARATHGFVPQIDAVVVVLGADPPISGDELALIAEVARSAETAIFVLNKADRLPAGERREASQFCARILEERLARPIGPILEVSATERLSSTGPARDWDGLVARLADLARSAGADLVKVAEVRATKALVERLVAALDDQERALLRPLDETRERLDALHRSTSEVERALEELGYLLSAEQDRLVRALRAEREEILRQATIAASDELRGGSDSIAGLPARERRPRAMAMAQEAARHRLDPWLEQERARTQQRYREAAQRFVELANAFLARFETARDLGLDRIPPPLGVEGGLRVGSRLFYTELLRLTTPSVLGWVLDRLRSRRRATGAVLAEATDYLERLLASNSARIQNDLIERISESRRGLEADIRGGLRQALEAGERGLERARTHQAAGREAVNAELARLGRLHREAQRLGMEN
ncbi:MAG TPA: dynamin family protein [Candidatus Methylomirabilis sp.]|nr:dynamin family protein [Candidatus Methylomirabilis sp.]